MVPSPESRMSPPWRRSAVLLPVLAVVGALWLGLTAPERTPIAPAAPLSARTTSETAPASADASRDLPVTPPAPAQGARGRGRR